MLSHDVITHMMSHDLLMYHLDALWCMWIMKEDLMVNP